MAKGARLSKVTEDSVAYWLGRDLDRGAVLVLSQGLLEMHRHVGDEQMQALCHAIGTRIAASRPLQNVKRLSELQAAASDFLSRFDLGWIQIETREDSIDFRIGCTPLRRWFDPAGMVWAPALYEGLFSEWLRQLGAGEKLELRWIGKPSGEDDIMNFRLARDGKTR